LLGFLAMGCSAASDDPAGARGKSAAAAGAGQDLDVAGAKARYDMQQAIADQADDAYRAEASKLGILQGQLASANQEVHNDQYQVDELQRTIANLDSQTRQEQSSLSSSQSQLSTARASLSEAQSRLSQAQTEQTRARQDVDRWTRQVQDLEAQLAQLQGKTPPAPPAQIDAVKAQLSRANQNLSSAQQASSQADQTVSSDFEQVSSLNGDVARYQQDVTNEQDQLTNIANSRSEDLVSLNTDESALGLARNNVTTISNQVTLEQSDVRSAKTKDDAAQTQAQTLYAYYQQVQNNYNQALNAVYATADMAANKDAAHEATDRAPSAGKRDGEIAGTAAGSDKGTADGNTRDEITGYAYGRAHATTDAALAGSYATGTSDGAAAAAAKAHAENYPKGYNDTLASTLAAPPANTVSLDITSAIPDGPTAAAADVATTALPVGVQSGPAFPIPAGEIPMPPVYTPPSVDVPASDGRYANPPCTGLVLPEFTPLCQAHYAASYAQDFAQNYQAGYLSAYAPAFTSDAAMAYEAAYEVANPASETAGRAKGAHDQGELDGFASSLAAAQTAAYAAGQTAAQAALAAGEVLVIRDVELLPTDPSALFVPAAYAQVKVTVDNYGGVPSAKGGLRLQIAGTTHADNVTFRTRDLPSFAPYTRTVLTGTTQLNPNLLAAGTPFTVSGSFEALEKDGTYADKGSFSETGTIHYPLEVSSFAFPSSVGIGKPETATLTFVNMTAANLPATSATLSTPNGEVSVAGSGAVSIPAIAAGASGTATVSVTPTDLVGVDAAVPFTLATTSGGHPWYVEPIPTTVPVTRDAALRLFDTSGAPVPSSTFHVQAGSTLWFNVRFDFMASDERGPFTIVAKKFSDPGLSSADNSTIEEDLGYWSPGTSQDDLQIGVDVAASLRGKTAYADIELVEGATTIHDLRVYIVAQ
jgi:hypothetical protein